MISLFKNHENQGATADNDEFLMHLEAEIPAEKEVKTQEAEFIVVVDRSGSMGGTPWKQVQDGLKKMLDLTRRQGNLKTKAIAYNHGTTQLRVTGTEEIDKAAITSLRASGSTNVVAVFKNLANIFDAE